MRGSCELLALFYIAGKLALLSQWTFSTLFTIVAAFKRLFPAI